MEYMARTSLNDLDLIITRSFNYAGPGQDSSCCVPKFVKSFQDKTPSTQLGNLDVVRDFTRLCESTDWQITQDIDTILKRMLNGK
ncbi:hypothetical protein [Pseudomonas sp.]|uniref:hypothetical protein n=1 Tax=Pseudomonas sp. TaxID=306 RepID=UPI00258D1615|nr:hypothetical protein [Pseudomonas sp.]